MSWGILELLRSDGSITVNKSLIRKVGLIEAVVYSELISRYCYFRDRDRLKKGYFYNTVSDLEEATGVSKRYQLSSIAKLQRLGLLEMRVMGVPATRHFRFTQDHIDSLATLLLVDGGDARARTETQRAKLARLFHAGVKHISPGQEIPDLTAEEAEAYGREMEKAAKSEAEKNVFRHALYGGVLVEDG